MDAKSRKVLNCLTKLGGEQEVFDLSIAIKMTEDAVQTHLGTLSEEGLVTCRRDGGKEFWSLASAQEEPARSKSEAKAPPSGKKRGKAMAGPDDSFADLIDEPANFEAAPAPPPPPIPAPAPPPIQGDSAVEDFEFAPAPAAQAPAGAGPDAAPEPKKERGAKRKRDDGLRGKPENDRFDPPPIKERPKREQSAGPDDRFQEFAEKVTAKPLPIQLMAWAAALALMLILFIMSSSSGGKAKKVKAELEGVRTELDSLRAKDSSEIVKLWVKTRALEQKINNLEEDAKKRAAAPKPAATVDNKAKNRRGR
jgi:DNA-binding transcriptional ArsR family regulator